MIDLRDELTDAICNLSPVAICQLRSLGIPEPVLFGWPLLVGLGKVSIFPSGFYEPNDEGDDVVIIAAGQADCLVWDALDDLIAFRPSDPGRWWRRVGAAQILGTVWPEPVLPLRLFDTPLSWLRAGATGACVIDWRVDPERLRGPIEVETSFLKARLERRIQQAALARFQISVRELSNVA